jgi:membrane-associated protein
MTSLSDTLLHAVQSHGLLMLFPLSVLEGPVVNVAAGWLARLGYLSLVPTYLVLVLGDLVGDALHYAVGRGGLRLIPQRWQRKLGIDPAALAGLGKHFHDKGGRTLVVAKLTHSLGFAALLAAGAAQMHFGRFMWFNLLGTLPKTLGFMALGYALGHASAAIDAWIWRASVLVVAAGIILGLIWWRKRKGARA